MTREINAWMSKTNVTHLLLDGGTLSAKEGFHEAYVRDVSRGERLCVVEKKTAPYFKFFVDVDYSSSASEEDCPMDFKKVALEIFRVVNLGPCVLARAAPRKNTKGGATKYGLHIVWPESTVTKQMANGIRMNILDEFGDPEWEKIIDSSVYSGSGLRMLWSYKNEKGSTPYVPWARIHADGTFEEFSCGSSSPSVDMLRLFTIRTTDAPAGGGGGGGPASSSSKNPELETFIRTNIPGQENARILKVSMCKNKKDYWVSTSSKYCENVKREHKSNHVWFVYKPGAKIIAQKCQDEECKGYTGRFYRIPSRLIPNERVLDTGAHRHIADYLPDGWKVHQAGHDGSGTFLGV